MITLRVLAGYCGRFLAIGLVIGAASPARSARGEGAPQGRVFTVHNESGMARTINVAGLPVMAVDNPFFLDLGVNGRRCITCHEPQSNMTVTPARLRARFDGELFAAGGQGGPEALSDRVFVFGVNDPLGCDATGATCTGSNPDFTSIVFTEYAAWSQLRGGGRNAARAAVARGQDLFNTLVIPITAVAGINDDFGRLGNFDVPIPGTCTTCHDTPHIGNHSVPAPLDIGLADPPVPVTQGGHGVHNRFGLPVGDMPVYTLRHKTSGELKVVTDPGRALITGRWKDVGRLKGPILRGLAGRGPYFHNGSAATLLDVVNFYDLRFNLGLNEQQKAELVAFLRTLEGSAAKTAQNDFGQVG